MGTILKAMYTGDWSNPSDGQYSIFFGDIGPGPYGFSWDTYERLVTYSGNVSAEVFYAEDRRTEVPTFGCSVNPVREVKARKCASLL